MAMRPIRSTNYGGGGVPSRRGRAFGPVYEDFKPMFEWRRQDEADTLIVHLPGFKKEEIKVTTENRNIVRIRGERPLTGNKWSRFQEDFLVPEYCDMRGIRAKFEGGILAVIMARKIIASVAVPRVDATPRIRTKQDETPPKPIPTPRNNQETSNRIVPDPQAAALASSDYLEKQGKTQIDPTPRNNQETNNRIVPNPQVAASASSAYLEKQGKTQKDPNIRSTDVDAEKEKEKSRPRHPTKALDDGDIPRLYVPTPSIVDREKQQDGKTSLEQKQGDHHKPSEAAAAAMSQMINATGNSRDTNKRKEPIDKAEKGVASSVAEKIIPNSNNVTNVASSSSAINKLEDYKKMVAKGLGKGGTEERELLVNMGVAILVIVALAAYVSYTTFGSSSGKA